MSSLELQAQKAYKTGIKWLAGAFILIGISVGGLWSYERFKNRPPAAIAAPLVLVELGNVENKMSEGGTLELGGQRTIKSPEEGAVDQILIKRGDRITINQELIILRNPERETILNRKQLDIQKQEISVERNRQKIEEAEEVLASAIAEYERDVQKYQQELKSKQAEQQLNIEKLKAQVERNRQKVEEAENNLKAEETELENLNKLLARGFVAQNEISQQERTVRELKATLRDTKLNLKNSKLEVETAQVQLIYPQRTVDDNIFRAEVDLRQAQSEYRQSQSELERLKLEYQKEALTLENNSITAPISGRVLEIHIQPGDGVNRSDELITLGDPNQELVHLNLSTLNAAKVKPNQLARISVIGPNSQVFTGRVQSIGLQASSENSGNNQNSSQATVPAIIKLDQPTGSLIPGSPVSVEVVLEERNNVVVLSTELIQREGNSPYVWILDSEEKAQKQPITLGLEGLIKVEIKSGLKSGDRVISPPPDTTLEPGTPILEQESDIPE